MTTFRDIQNTVLANLHSGVADQEQRCALTNPMTTGDLTLTVDDASQLSRGVIEIDSELMWVRTVDLNANRATLSAFGRGYNNSTVTAHAAGAMVVLNPSFPRAIIQNSISDTLAGLFPDLFQVKTYEGFVSSPAQVAYAAPPDCAWVLGLEWQAVGPTQAWVPVRRYRLDSAADGSFDLGVYTDIYGDSYGSGVPNKSIDIYDGMTPGRKVKVTYAAEFGKFASDTATLASVGLEESGRNLLIYGTTARMLQAMEPARLQTGAIEQQQRSELVQSGAAVSAAKSYWQMYQMELMARQQQLQSMFPIRTYKTR